MGFGRQGFQAGLRNGLTALPRTRSFR
jgi:hypothetical protein